MIREPKQASWNLADEFRSKHAGYFQFRVLAKVGRPVFQEKGKSSNI